MRTTGSKAFTLVELLIVIVIIGILSTLVIPSVVRVLDLAKQASCRVSVKELITGLRQYSSSSGEMPRVPVSGWDTAIGSKRLISPFDLQNDGTPPPATSRNHSSNLWLLLKREYVPASGFVCAGTTDIASSHQDISKSWDFSSSIYISYGLQSPYGFGGSLSVLTPPGVILIADGSPYVQDSLGSNPGKIKEGPDLMIVDWGGALDGLVKMRRGNSPNHEGQGQNVGFIDGRADWRTSAACGKNGDNIYTARNEKVRQEGKNTEYGAGSLTPGIRNNPNDTLILP